MKNLKIFVALIAMIFTVGTTSKAQCFDMNIDTQYSALGKYYFCSMTITVNNYSSGTVIITDNANQKSEACSKKICQFTWEYRSNINTTASIECGYLSSGSCTQFDGCTIPIEPHILQP